MKNADTAFLSGSLWILFLKDTNCEKENNLTKLTDFIVNGNYFLDKNAKKQFFLKFK